MFGRRQIIASGAFIDMGVDLVLLAVGRGEMVVWQGFGGCGRLVEPVVGLGILALGLVEIQVKRTPDMLLDGDGVDGTEMLQPLELPRGDAHRQRPERGCFDIHDHVMRP